MAFRPVSSGSQKIIIDDKFYVRTVSPSQSRNTEMVTERHVNEEKRRKEGSQTQAAGQLSGSGSKSTNSPPEKPSRAERFSRLHLTESSDARTLPALAEHLEEEIYRHKKTHTFLQEKERNFAERLNRLILQNTELRNENSLLRVHLHEESQRFLELEERLRAQKKELHQQRKAMEKKVSQDRVSPASVDEYVELGRRMRHGERDVCVEKKRSRTDQTDGNARSHDDRKSRKLRDETLDYVNGHRRDIENQQMKSRNCPDMDYHVKKLAQDLDRKTSTINRLRAVLGEMDDSSLSTVTPSAPARSSESVPESSPRQRQLQQRLSEREDQEERIQQEAQQARRTERRTRERSEAGRSRDEVARSERLAAKFTNTQGNRPSSPCKPFHNPRYGSVIVARRSSRERSLDRVLEHRSKYRVPMGTIFRPRRSVLRTVSTKKLNLEETMKADKYVLEHQDADDVGNVQTHLFKGDIIPTSGGGRAVIFKDVETLAHKNPLGATTSRSKLVEMQSSPSGKTSRFCCD
ncbi:hypothetical protein RvY_09741 [Ramazzottius varieornatus]|uniref:Kinesin-like protein Kif23 Arf6-interacting domain-containing protein n=1 Tax=Ramazzottius varieornatus TaxID=947166 RepID=A0A1D1VFT2_RAMVA|nr:hypothetical protein RvY_09741 [Ramazzottius varieornatus]